MDGNVPRVQDAGSRIDAGNAFFRSSLGIARVTGQSRSQDGSVRIIPLPGLPMFAAGDDLAAAIADALGHGGLTLADGDVLVVAQKIISKAEGRAVLLQNVEISGAARELAATSGKDSAVAQLILDESESIMRAKPGLVIARHRLGHVAANAGIDASNVADTGGDTVLLWPVDPDASAGQLRRQLEGRFGVQIAVVISDSLGRAWRIGTVGTAIGSSGLSPLIDRRGETDLFGRVLQATLVIGEAAEGLPVAIIRGAAYIQDELQGIGPILRPQNEDLFK